MQTLRKNKVSLIRTLSTDARFILQYVQQDNIITDREYSNLNHETNTTEEIVIKLLDTVMNKDDETCCKFVDLLQQEDVQETFPGLQQVFNPAPASHNQENPVRAIDEEDDCYAMTRRPVGHCLIINNHKFGDIALMNRNGTDIDKDALKEVFERMHFLVEERRDLSSSDILKVLTEFSVKDHSEMDAYVCCILTHGGKGIVLGTDGKSVPIRDLTLPLAHCPTLTGKPKLFFIQACQGSKMHESIWRQVETEEQMKAHAPPVNVATPLRRTWTQAMQTLRKNKVSLIRTLSTDARFILQYVQQDNIITDRHYTNFKHNNHTKDEDIVINLLDTVMSKGDATCCNFLDLLQREDVQDTFPHLKLLFTPAHISVNQGKPKLFFIQACQGTKLQKGLWKHYGTEKDDAEKVDLSRIPIEADFLIGMSTLESYVSFRHSKKGSVYIQELCKHLKTGCQKQEDILTILTRVNRGVAARDINSGNNCYKQMPEPRYTLTNKLVLPID
ncbi:uncharacterized protein Hap1MRO34_008047 [Clarias gariepinus]|uniref:uncharacterized protein LOC128526714 n=1 Tax=Clarias gariepinus TaxID=13013 RepID=UPI00234C2254|nr:uncharacterized protein LOC128526714 [Clarias gariepinus]